MNKILKKIISLALISMMLFGTASAAFAFETNEIQYLPNAVAQTLVEETEKNDKEENADTSVLEEGLKTEESTDIVGGVINSTQEEKEAYYESLTEEQKAIVHEKQNLPDLPPVKKSARASILRKLPKSYKMEYQTKDNYCMPATAQAIITYFKGYSDSQAKIASAIGTTSSGSKTSKLISYLNEKQSTNHYIEEYRSTQKEMEKKIYTGITYFKAPVAVVIQSTFEDGWGYEAENGHVVSVYGVTEDRSLFYFADSIGKFTEDGKLAEKYDTTSGRTLFRVLNTIIY